MRRAVPFFILLLALLTLCRVPILAAVEMPAATYLKGLAWLGHASFKWVRGGTTVYFDPWRLSAEEHDADLILIGHPHFDHCDAADVGRAAGPKTTIVTVADCAEKLKVAHLPGTIRVVKPGDKIQMGQAHVEVVPAYNVDKNFHPKESGWAGFIVELDGVRLYHAGDTDFIPEMNEMKVDVALLPVSGVYVMDAAEAARAAKAINLKVAVPMHYGSIVGSKADAKRFQELAAGVVVEILEKGSRR